MEDLTVYTYLDPYWDAPCLVTVLDLEGHVEYYHFRSPAGFKSNKGTVRLFKTKNPQGPERPFKREQSDVGPTPTRMKGEAF